MPFEGLKDRHLLCPSCGGQMRVIVFMEDHKVIDRIIRHLK
ncbi:MAG: hypothetical protein WBC02_03250 [Candidatus Aminicenantaceae bacterium]